MIRNNETEEQKIYKRRYRKTFIPNIENKGKTRATGARVWEDLFLKLDEIAKNENRTINYLINMAVKNFNEQYSLHEQAEDEKEEQWLSEYNSKPEEEQKTILTNAKLEIVDLNL